jgi:hypothetical protein
MLPKAGQRIENGAFTRIRITSQGNYKIGLSEFHTQLLQPRYSGNGTVFTASCVLMFSHVAASLF